MKKQIKAVVLLLAVSTLVGCADLNQSGTGTQAAKISEQSTTPVPMAEQTKPDPEPGSLYDLKEETLEELTASVSAYYHSGVYQNRFPVRNDLIWCT